MEDAVSILLVEQTPRSRSISHVMFIFSKLVGWC